MTLIPNNDLIDYDNKWNANLDSLRNYIVDGYDFTNDYEAFIIKIPTYKEFPFKSFGEFSQHLGIPELRQQLADGTIDQTEFDKKMNELDYVNNFKKIPKEIKNHNKNAGKYQAIAKFKSGKYDWLGGATTDIYSLENKIKNHHIKKQEVIYKGKRYLNQKDVDDFKLTEKFDTKIADLGIYGETYRKFHSKTNVFKANDFRKAMNKSNDEFTAYIQSTHPEAPNNIHAYPGTDEDIASLVDNYEHLKMVQIVNDSNNLEMFIGSVFGEDFMTLSQPNIKRYHPSKIEILSNIIKEIRRNHPDIENKKINAIVKAEDFLKLLQSENYKKSLAIKDKIREENENKGVIDYTLSGLEKVFIDIPQNVLSLGVYDKKERDIMIGNRNLFSERVKELTTNSNGQNMSTEINGRKASKIRWALQNNQDLFSDLFSSTSSYVPYNGNVLYYDSVMLPIFQDLKQEFMMETKAPRYNSTAFATWLSQHPDKMYSESKDNEFYSFYEMLEVGRLQSEKHNWSVHDSELNQYLNVSNDMVGRYNTIRLAYENYEEYKRTRVHPDNDSANLGEMRDLDKQMIHTNPELAIAYLQASKENRLDSSGTYRTVGGVDSFPMLTEEQESILYNHLTEAFGHDIDFYNIKRPFYPTVDDILPEYFDVRFIND